MARTDLGCLHRRARSCAFIAAIALSFLAGSAHAALLSTVVNIGVQSGLDSGSFSVSLPVSKNPIEWHLAAPVNVYSATNPADLLATIGLLDVTLDPDPSVLLSFAVTAGGAPTNFTISSGVVAFAPILNPSGFATAAITVTDNDGNPAGATMTGLFPGNKAYEAQYNGATAVFADLVSPVTAAPNDSNTGSERFPVAGFAPLVPPVNNIQSQFSFSLTALDSASGTSRFTVVPEPSSIVLALLGAIGLLWHLRRRFS